MATFIPLTTPLSSVAVEEEGVVVVIHRDKPN